MADRSSPWRFVEHEGDANRRLWRGHTPQRPAGGERVIKSVFRLIL
jgi:hypothetical protein